MNYYTDIMEAYEWWGIFKHESVSIERVYHLENAFITGFFNNYATFITHFAVFYTTVHKSKAGNVGLSYQYEGHTS